MTDQAILVLVNIADFIAKDSVAGSPPLPHILKETQLRLIV